MSRPTEQPSSALLQAYLAAVYRVELPDGDCRLRIGVLFDPGKTLGPVDTPWALVSACNPRSQPAPRMVNEAAHSQMRAQIDSEGLRSFPAHNSDARGQHAEPGLLLLGIEPARADRLARTFGQNAILAGRIGAPVRLRCYLGAWRGVAMDTAFVDWVGSPASDDRRA